MLAVLDETYPELRKGIAYVVSAAVLTADENAARAALECILTDPRRERPFHWNREGPQARSRMIRCLEDLGAVAHVCIHYPTGRRRVEAARAKGITTIVPRLVSEGASRLLIEARGPIEDARDRAVILDTLNDLNAAGAFAYEWHNKTEPLVWLADAVCGAVREYLIEPNSAEHYDRLVNSGVIAQPMYISGA